MGFNIIATEKIRFDCADYAMVDLRLNHDDYLKEQNGGVNLDELFNFVKKRLVSGDLHIAIDMSEIWLSNKWLNNKSNGRGVKIISHICDCEYDSPRPIKIDEFRKLWSNEFIELVKRIMVHLGQKDATVYFYGDKARIVQLNADK